MSIDMVEVDWYPTYACQYASQIKRWKDYRQMFIRFLKLSESESGYVRILGHLGGDLLVVDSSPP